MVNEWLVKGGTVRERPLLKCILCQDGIYMLPYTKLHSVCGNENGFILTLSELVCFLINLLLRYLSTELSPYLIAKAWSFCNHSNQVSMALLQIFK